MRNFLFVWSLSFLSSSAWAIDPYVQSQMNVCAKLKDTQVNINACYINIRDQQEARYDFDMALLSQKKIVLPSNYSVDTFNANVDKLCQKIKAQIPAGANNFGIKMIQQCLIPALSDRALFLEKRMGITKEPSPTFRYTCGSDPELGAAKQHEFIFRDQTVFYDPEANPAVTGTMQVPKDGDDVSYKVATNSLKINFFLADPPLFSLLSDDPKGDPTGAKITGAPSGTIEVLKGNENAATSHPQLDCKLAQGSLFQEYVTPPQTDSAPSGESGGKFRAD